MQLGYETSWIRLYAILDSIKYDTIEKFKNEESKNKESKNKYDFSKILDIDKKKIDGFTGAANCYGLLFLDARHGNQGWEIPSKTISHEQAISLIRKLIYNYIDYIDKVA